MTAALDDLVKLLDLEPIEVNIFRGRSPDENRQRVFGGQVAGQALVAATRIDRRARTASSTRCTPTSCVRATRTCRSSTRSTGSATARASPRAASSRSSTVGRSSTCRPASTSHEPGPDHQITMPPGLPDPESLPDFKTRMAPYKDRMGEWYERPPPDRHPLHRRRSVQPPGQAGRRPAGVDARRRRAARRPHVARLHRHLRQRHDAARHDRAAVRALVGESGHADGQPRPRDVVPPPVPRRRLAALRPDGDLQRRRPRVSPAGRSSPPTARSPSPSCKRASHGSGPSR